MDSEKDVILKISNLKKRYRLGVIGGGTLMADIQSWWARIRKKEDPNAKIGAKTYGKNETFMALDGIDLTVYKGERLGIIGHNGAGKSTLLKLLSRVTGPTEGEIGLNGRISSMLEVGTGFNPELTGRENIYLNGAILGMTKAEVDKKIDQIIEFSECSKFIDTPVKRYSSGMYVKLAFAVAAHLDSEILVMDEVLAVGDMKFQQKCLNKMSEVSKEEGRTILYVSHNMSTIRQLCSRCVVMDHGKIVFDGEVEKAIEKYLDIVSNEAPYLNLENEPRLSLNEGIKVHLLETAYVDRDNIRFSKKEKQVVRLKWKNEADVSNLCLRIEVLKRDRTPVATAMLYDFYAGKNGDCGTVCVEIDVSTLIPGQYTTIYTMFQKDSKGSTVNLDNVNGLSFEIVQEDDDIVWDERNWGSIRLPDLKIK
ncbi:MAG: ABC transporter ATP-binding protein [Clostridia bacterium]|nr:ABC transporter ATP-binding protein [Clostridia bacterium]